MPPHRKVVPVEKKCTVCKRIKPITEFYEDARRRDGHYSKCKKCHNKSVKKWQINNSSKFKEINSSWKKAHKEQRAVESKQWAKAHPEYRRRVGEKWRSNHPNYGKNWRENNRDKIKHYAQNRRARMEGNGGTLTVQEWNAILDFYGHKCLCCERKDVKLTIDHIIPIFRGGKHCAENVQPLCGPCNSRKKDKVIDYRKEYYAPTRD